MRTQQERAKDFLREYKRIVSKYQIDIIAGIQMIDKAEQTPNIIKVGKEDNEQIQAREGAG